MIPLHKMYRVLFGVPLLIFSLAATAAPPNLQTKGRVIYLADNLDEGGHTTIYIPSTLVLSDCLFVS